MVSADNSTDVLKAVFADYCGGQKTMEGKSFAKLAKDTKLVDKKLTNTDVDLIFAKVKDKSERRITFAQFSNGLAEIAKKKGVDVSVINAKVGESKGPILAGTKADAVKFHDDKSLYTGVYAQGGPSTVDAGNGRITDISQLADRSAADVRGVKQGGASVAEITHKVAGVVIEEKKTTKKSGGGASASAAAAGSAGAAAASQSAGAASLKDVFNTFSQGQAEIDGKTFAKIAKDCKVINKKCTNTDIDLIFAKSKDRTARKINYNQFLSALEQCATKRGDTMEALETVILGAGGPVFSGTKADAVKFHDDKNLYTGVYAQGGPSTVDAGNGRITDISQLADRSAADVRGVKR